jgi:tRNA(Leu) C34 or U34 (ribose-2'-O)-methylase TrmL
MKRGYACIALDHPKFDGNVGGALRAVACYDADMIVISGDRFKREPTDTTKAHRHVPTIIVNDVFDAIPYDCTPVAVEIVDGAVSLPQFVHPERAFYVFGAEDATLGKRILGRCKHVVSVPTSHCMNLAATVNVLLYDRAAKAARQ